MNKPNCRTCKYHGVMLNPSQQILTICRRNPPQVFATLAPSQKGLQWVSTVAWPLIADDDWCGEYEIEVVLQ